MIFLYQKELAQVIVDKLDQLVVLGQQVKVSLCAWWYVGYQTSASEECWLKMQKDCLYGKFHF